MGYTHYWNQSKSFDDAQWDAIVKKTRKIFTFFKDNEVVLQYEFDDPREPVADDEIIRFNGVGGNGHETFLLSKELSHNKWEDKSKPSFNFCKTARKPYDTAVCLVLLVAHSQAPDVVSVSSDGNWKEEWETAQKAYVELFNEVPVCPFEKNK